MVGTTATVSVGLAVGAAFILLLTLAVAFSPKNYCRDSGQSDYVSFSIPFWEKISEEIVIGKVATMESRIAPDPYNSEMKRFTFVTIDVEDYLKDGARSGTNQLTFKDSGSASCYPYGQRAVFFIWKAGDDGSLQSNWYTSKFVIDESHGTVQSGQVARFDKEPKMLQEFEANIRAAVANPQ